MTTANTVFGYHMPIGHDTTIKFWLMDAPKCAHVVSRCKIFETKEEAEDAAANFGYTIKWMN